MSVLTAASRTLSGLLLLTGAPMPRIATARLDERPVARV